MPVTSTPMGATQRATRPSPAMLPRGCVVTAALVMLRVIAVVLILTSTFGNYVQFIGGWAFYWPPQWTVLLYAAIYQIVCSLFQWGFKAMRWWVPYLIALLASAIPSFLTYNALFGPYLALQVGAIPALIGIGIAVVGGDALPEWVLVE